MKFYNKKKKEEIVYNGIDMLIREEEQAMKTNILKILITLIIQGNELLNGDVAIILLYNAFLFTAAPIGIANMRTALNNTL